MEFIYFVYVPTKANSFADCLAKHGLAFGGNGEIYCTAPGFLLNFLMEDVMNMTISQS